MGKGGHNFIDLTGQQFGRLTVLKRVHQPEHLKKRTDAYWLCECNCKEKNKIIIDGVKLRNGNTKSCGCLQKEIATKIAKDNKKYNKYNLSGDYGIGYTTKGEEFYFDLEDYNKIKDYCWMKHNGYIVTVLEKERISMHREIINCPSDIEVDHKNHNTYDNRKQNLRVANASQNNMNKGLRKHNTSGVTGVSWNNRDNRWVAQIGFNKKNIHLGNFVNFEDAVNARKKAEIKYFGEYRYNPELILDKSENK